MLTKKQKWLIGAGLTAAAALIAMVLTGYALARRFDPYIRKQAISYLSSRFESDVEIGSLRIDIPKISLMRLFWTQGTGVLAGVAAEDVVMRQRNSPSDQPPMFRMKRIQFAVDLGEVFRDTKRISTVQIEQMEIQVPPKGERPKTSSGKGSGAKVTIDHITLTDSRLVILPRDRRRNPLEFALHKVELNSIGEGQPLRYRAKLTNALPPGTIDAAGKFGPWNVDSPSDTPLDGNYTFNNADLGVFSGIQGTLNSQGQFQGTLAAVEARGEADVPDFRLRMAGTPVPLHTSFEALVDGTNGNTVLKPVHAQLGTSAFVTSGAILKRDREAKHSIDLDVAMEDGEMMDLLGLAAKAKPMMAGRIQMIAKIRIPPLQGTVREKLILDGRFHIRRGQFLMKAVQDKVDTLSRRGQGQPKNDSIGDVFSDMAGEFHLENQNLRFTNLSFGVPGSKVDLAGEYDMSTDNLDFQGSLRLDARVSKTTTGWKSWLLKALDPLFAKKGSGTFLKIKVSGSSKDPQFGAKP